MPNRDTTSQEVPDARAIARCAGCDTRSAYLTPFENGRAYCARCSEEVEAMGWSKRR